MPEANDIPKNANDLSKIPTDELVIDLIDAVNNLRTYEWALAAGIANYSNGLNVLSGWKSTIEFIEAVMDILKARH